MNDKFKVALMLAVFTSLGGCSQSDTASSDGDKSTTTKEETAKNLLVATETGFKTTHSLAYVINADEYFSIVSPDNRTDNFNGTPYDITRAAFVRADAAVMIHAETVADGSGASNYDDLPLANWPAEGFRSEGAVCFAPSPEDIEGESDPEWLAANGFNFVGTLMFAQYFLSSADYNDEIVVSLMLHRDSCDDSEANAAAFKDLQSEISVTPIK